VIDPFSVGELLFGALRFVNNDILNATDFGETMAKSNNCYKRGVLNSTQVCTTIRALLGKGDRFIDARLFRIL